MSRHQTYFTRQPERLQAYLDGLTRVAGHSDRVVPIENYTKGLMLPIERKSVEPMAARLAPGNVRQMAPVTASHSGRCTMERCGAARASAASGSAGDDQEA